MNTIDFLKTIYIGDRGCKAVVIDGWNAEIKLQITCISRVRSATWDYYTAEDLIDGYIVFKGVESFSFNPVGLIPNDLINDIKAEVVSGDVDKFQILLSIDSVDSDGNHKEVELKILAKGVELESVDSPSMRIRT